MRTLKSILVILIITSVTTVCSASEVLPPGERVKALHSVGEGDLSREIGSMLRMSELVFREEMKVLLIFEVTPQKKIMIHSILSRDTAFQSFLQKRLQNRKLRGSSWEKGQLYIVPLRMKVSR